MRVIKSISTRTFMLFFVLFGLSVILQAAPSDKKDTQKPIQIVGDIAFAPYTFINENGQPDGFFIELTKAVMHELKQPYTIKLEEWPKAMSQLKNKKIDFITGISHSESRDKLFKFGGSYVNITQNIIYRKDDEHIRTLSDLKNKKIIVETDAMSQYYLEKAGYGRHLYKVNDITIGFKLLSQGYYDALMCDYETAAYIIFHKGYGNLEMVDMQLTSRLYSYAGNSELQLSRIDWALQRLKANGTYSDIYNKWFNRYADFKWLQLIIISGISLILIAAFLWIFNIVLRRRVEKAHAMLDTKNKQLSIALHAGGIVVWGYDVQKDLLFNIECDYFPPQGVSPEKDLLNYHPDDRKLLYDSLHEAAKGNIPEKPICVRMSKVGTDEWLYAEKEFSAIKNKEGKVVTVIGTHKNVTEKHRMQALLEESVQRMGFAIKTANLVLWEYDVNTQQIKSYNEPLVDYNDSKMMFYERLLGSIHPDDVESTSKKFEGMNKQTEATFSFAMRLRYQPNEDWHYCMTIGSPFIRDSKTGKVLKYVGLRRDVTEMTLMNQKLEQEKVKAQEADRLKSAFLANMSHEIRTPLNAIVGFSGLLEDCEDPAVRSEYIKIINNNNNLLLQLINDILDLSKIESGILEIHRKEFDFSTAFNDLHHTFQARMGESEVKFLCDNPYDEFIVYSDYNRLIQIQTNFITNALKYTKKGYVKMSYRYEDEGLKLIVEDTGIGIAEEKKNRIFQRFEKLDKFAQGTGLGLSICKAIVDAANGKIGFDSVEGEGSTFWAWIPCKICRIVQKGKQT